MIACRICPTGNTGIGDNAKTIAKTVGAFFVPTVADDGTTNVLPIGGAPALIDLETYLNNSDPSKRWYPLMGLKDVAIDPSAADYKTYGDKSKDLLGTNGNRVYSFKGTVAFKDALAGLQKNLQRFACREMSVFLVTVEDSIFGEMISTDLVPVEIRAFDPVGMFANDSANAEISITFDFYSEFQYGRLRQMCPDNFTYFPSRAKGLRTVNFNYTVAGASSSTVVLTTDFANGFIAQDVHGLIAADFSINNNTTGLAVTILTVTETANTDYVITYASQTVADELTIKVLPNAKKYDGSGTKVIA